MNRAQLLESIEGIYDAAISGGFLVSSGKPWYVTRIPSISGTNEELQQKNAQLTAQMNLWNDELGRLWFELSKVESGLSGVTPILDMWGSASNPIPNGYTINYGDLLQQYQLAISANNFALADSIAQHLNAITVAGPVKGGYVPVIGVTDQGDPITPGPGTVYGPSGVTTVPPPTISGAIPPGPTSNTFPSATTVPDDGISVLPGTPATGGQPSVGSPVPQVEPATAGTKKTTDDVVMVLGFIAVAVAVLYLLSE